MYGLLGRKLGHSLSPQIHALLGSVPYELYCREPEELEEFFADETKRAYNVTIPYKVDAYRHCAELSDTAKKIGSVNTVIRRADGTLYGDNTDYFGFSFMAEKCGANFANKKVLVLGSGGASLTVCAVARDSGARQVIVVSRSGEDNYENLDKHADADIIVNTTPVGMFPNCPARLIDLERFDSLECVLDLIYNPAKTQLLMDAERLGISHSNGLVMLAAQALKSAEQFMDKPLDTAMINDICKKISAEQKNIVLIGMPGCGKSTAGKAVAVKAGRVFADTDTELELSFGKKIPEIFAQNGEEFFRQLETQTVTEIGKKSGMVIATGGGTVLREENRNALKQNAVVIYLKKDVEKLATGGRPLSKDIDTVKKIFAERREIYESFADYTVEVDDNPDVTAERIMKCIF